MRWSSFLIALLAQGVCFGASQKFAWDASPSPNVAGYRLYYGPARGFYTNAVDVGKVTSATVDGLVIGRSYYLAVTAYSDIGIESDFSNEAFLTPEPIVPTMFIQVAVDSADRITGQWIPFTSFVWTARADSTQKFWRVRGVGVGTTP